MKNQTACVSDASKSYDPAKPTCLKKKVLLVDDDPGTRQFLARHLRDHEIKVFEADTGDAAFGVVETGLKPDLLLTDVVMPGTIQGPELAKKARAMVPGLQVLFMSGYPVDVSHHAADVSPTDQQLIKPVTQERLLATIKELLVDTEPN